jgi:soluble lytic murein transglycosylase-like protein
VLPIALLALIATGDGRMYMSIGPDGTPVVTDYPRNQEKAVEYEPGDFEAIALGQKNTPHRGLGSSDHRARAAPDEIERLLRDASAKHGVALSLLRAVVAVESNFKSDAVSRAGAMGLMQLMPGTAKDMGVKDAFDPAQNVNGGARYLAFLLKHFKDEELAVAAYNAGPGRVGRAGRIPDIPETQAYVVNVLGLARAYEGMLDPR